MALKQFLDLTKDYRESLARHEKETQRLEEQLDVLEKARAEAFNAVADDHADGEAHLRLDTDDNRLAELRKEINAQQRKARAKLQAMRSRILQTQEKSVESLQQNLQKKQERHTRLKHETIPQAEARLAALIESDARIEEEIRSIQNEIRQMTDLDLDDLFED